MIGGSCASRGVPQASSCAKYGSVKAPRAASALAVLALCSLLFGLMAVVAKAAAARLPGAQVAFVRFLFGLAACALISAREWWLLALVAALSVIAQVGFTWSMRYVRAAPAGTIQQLRPVNALALGWLVYDDRIPPLSAAGAVLALTGVS